MTPRRVPLALATLLATACALLLTTSSASASPIYTTTLIDASSDGGFHGPWGIAVDESAEAVYVADSAQNRILKFDLSGNPVNFSALGSNVLEGGETPAQSITYASFVAVNPVSHTLYVTDYLSHVVDEFNAEGRYIGQLTGEGTPGGLGWGPISAMVDPSGNIWVADQSGDVIDEFDSSGHFLTSLNLASPGSGAESLIYAAGIAFDAAGNIYALGYNPNFGRWQVDKFNSSLTFQSVFDSNNAYAVSVDVSNGNVFTNEGGSITEFNSSGVEIAKLGASLGVSFEGIAVDSVTHSVYATEYGGGRAYVFSLVTNPQTLKVEKTGSGSGEVVGTAPLGLTAIQCGSICEAEYNKGAQVTLTAEPNERSTTHWNGCETEVGNQCTVTLNAATNVKAEFTAIPQKALKVEKTGSGSGTVTSAALTGFTPVDCGSTCTAEFNQGATITLTAEPGPTSNFTGWSGCKEVPIPAECTVEMSEAKTAKAEFTLKKQTLTVTPNGPGSVSASGGAISNCSSGGGTCVGTYNETSTATLTATPDAHNHVTWSGCSHSSANTCEITLGLAVSNVEATFSINRHTLTVTPSGPGSVSANEGAISACAAHHLTCSGIYDETSTVTLTATPSAHSSFVAWSGCTHSSADICEVQIGASEASVAATFASNKHTLTVTPIGSGSIGANSGAISKCSSSGGVCSGEYIEAATLTLTAAPVAGEGVAWGGCTHSSADICEVMIGASAASVDATFAQITHALTIAKAGMGMGTVTCDGGPCASRYNEGATLTLAATAAPGSTFSGWSGAGCSGTGSCKVTIEADTTLTATFNPQAEELKLPPSNLVELGSATQHGAGLTLVITVPGAGALSASGRNLKTATGSATAPGNLSLKLQLTSAAQKLLERKGKIKVRVTVLFTPIGGSPGTAAKTVTFRPEHTKQMGGRHG